MKTSFRALVLASFSLFAFVACGGQADTSSNRSFETSTDDPGLAESIAALSAPAAPGVGTKATSPTGEATTPSDGSDTGSTEIQIQWECAGKKGTCNVTGIGSAIDCKNDIVSACSKTKSVTISW